MTKLPSISIIIPTLNRKKVLGEALLSLNKVKYPRDRLEVVVVSDGSTDGTKKMVQSMVKDKKIKYQLIFRRIKNSGISRAKNEAIKVASGEIIVSTDDDCLFEPNWLKKLIKPLEDAKVGCAGGPDQPVEQESLIAKSIDFAFSSYIGSGGVHGRFLKVQLGKFYPLGCNMAFRKKMVEKIGYYDEKLMPGEETDFNHRIEKAGYKLVYVPNSFVWHRPRSTIKKFIPYIFKRGAARVEVLRRHREYAEFVYFLPAAMVLVAGLFLVLGFISPIFWQVFLLLLVGYGLVLSIAGISAFLTYRHPFFLFSVPLLIGLQHTLHGLGFWKAVIKLAWREN